jgi:hypothetical protein
MPNDRQQECIDDLLNLLANRRNRNRRQTRVVGPDGRRITDEEIDETAIDEHNKVDNQLVQDDYLLDCHHPARGNLGGRCHFCDALVCRVCIALCYSCGLATCPPHRVIADFDGVSRNYCRTCAEEIKRSLKLRAWGNAIFSFFVSSKRSS